MLTQALVQDLWQVSGDPASADPAGRHRRSRLAAPWLRLGIWGQPQPTQPQLAWGPGSQCPPRCNLEGPRCNLKGILAATSSDEDGRGDAAVLNSSVLAKAACRALALAPGSLGSIGLFGLPRVFPHLESAAQAVVAVLTWPGRVACSSEGLLSLDVSALSQVWLGPWRESD